MLNAVAFFYYSRLINDTIGETLTEGYAWLTKKKVQLISGCKMQSMARLKSIPMSKDAYLGTFRERVCLTISVAQLGERDWSDALRLELKKGIGKLVFLNGNLDDEQLRPYMRAAVQEHASFTFKNGSGIFNGS